jgi:hypothetical protein
VDVTQALHSWFASVPDGSTLRFGAGKCYRIDGGLVVTDRQGLTFDGEGATFKVVTAGHGQRSNWIVQGGGDITLRNMIARGANPKAGAVAEAYVRHLEWQHAYRLRGVQGALLENVQGYDVYGDFVNLSHDARKPFPGPPNRHIVVRNSQFARNGRYGITVTNGEHFTFENNTVRDVRWSGVNIELNGFNEVGRHLVIAGNRFGTMYHHVIVSAGAGVSTAVGDVTIRGNVMEADASTCLAPIAIQAPQGMVWSGWTIEGNTLYPQTGGWAIDLRRVRGVTIRNNAITSRTHGGCGSNHTMNLADAHDVAITGNTLTTGYLAHGRFWTTTHGADALTTGVTASSNIVK